MEPEGFVRLPLPPEVIALGRPDRVEGSPILAPLNRWGFMILGGVIIVISGFFLYRG